MLHVVKLWVSIEIRSIFVRCSADLALADRQNVNRRDHATSAPWEIVVREARSGERISFVTSAEKGSLELILEPSASGSFALDCAADWNGLVFSKL